MSGKRVLTLLLSVAVIAAVASVVSIRHPASGAPTLPAGPAVRSLAAPVTELQAKPDAQLSLPTTLHLIDHTTAGVRASGGRLIFTALLSHPKGGKAGGAVYSCNPIGNGQYRCASAFALAGGVLYGQVEGAGASLTGKITGGAGKFAHAKGDIKSVPQGNDANMTISYSTG